jgi:hypothetical protein
VKGKWRLMSMAMWDKDFLDMIEPAHISFDAQDSGTLAFGCITATLNCSLTTSDADFTFEGQDEMETTSGEGWAELQTDGTIEGEITLQNGDESTFIATRW